MAEQQNDNEKPPIADRFYLCYLLFYALGITSVLSMYFFTTANDYWMYKFRDINGGNDTNGNKTELQAQFTATFGIASNITTVLFLVITVLLAKRIGVLIRLIGSSCVMLILFTVTMIFVEINTDSWQNTFFVITMIMGTILGASGSIFMISLYQLVFKFPERYLSAILSGQSICGIFSALAQILALSIGANSLTDGLIYFLIGTFVVFVTLLALILSLYRSVFFRYHYEKPFENGQRPKITRSIFISALHKVKFNLLSIILALGVSQMVSPAVTSLVQSTNKGNGDKWNDLYFVPVITFFLYNTFDWIGRELAGKILKPSNSVIVLVASILRIGFIPLLMFCNAQPRHHLSVVFGDVSYIIFVIIFSFSNGYIVNLNVLRIPAITTPEEKPVAMLMLFVCILLPLLISALLGSALVSVL